MYADVVRILIAGGSAGPPPTAADVAAWLKSYMAARQDYQAAAADPALVAEVHAIAAGFPALA